MSDRPTKLAYFMLDRRVTAQYSPGTVGQRSATQKSDEYHPDRRSKCQMSTRGTTGKNSNTFRQLSVPFSPRLRACRTVSRLSTAVVKQRRNQNPTKIWTIFPQFQKSNSRRKTLLLCFAFSLLRMLLIFRLRSFKYSKRDAWPENRSLSTLSTTG